MKNIFFSVVLLLSVFTSYAQQIEVSSTTQNGIVKLRWMPTQAKLWEASNDVGFNVKRYTISDNGVVLDNAQKLASEVTLATALKPISKVDIQNNIAANNYLDNEAAEIIIKILYDGVFLPNPTPESGSDIKANQEINQDRYFGTSIISDGDFELAKSVALGLEDNTIDINDTYQYVINFISNNIEYVGIHTIDPTQSLDVNGPTNLIAKSGDLQIELTWDKLDESYYAYNIERSIDGVNFEKINDVPYSFSVSSDIDNIPTGIVIFVDNLPSNNIPYYYRVEGMTSFNINSNYSQIVQGEGVDGPIEFDLNVDVESINDIGVNLVWNSPVDPIDLAKVDHYDVFKSKSPTIRFEKVNNNPLPSTQTGFSDTNNSRAYYYLVVMTDVNGHRYESQSKLAQSDDITPPAIPSGLSVVPDYSGEIVISWDENTEEDLSGYRVFRSNMLEGSFFDVSKKSLKSNSFIDYVDTDVLTNLICYKVLSVDKRGNYSEMTQPICVDRPDHVGPDNPFLVSAFPSINGVKLTWELSQAIDLESHKLQRKRIDSPNWIDVVSWDPTSPIHSQAYGSGTNRFNYLDKSSLQPVTYQYRLVAYDTEGNNSTSLIKTVKPLPSKSVTQIENFELTSTCSDEAIKEYLSVLQSLQMGLNQLATAGGGSSTTTTILVNMLASGGITFSQYGALANQTNAQITTYVNGQIQNVQEKLYNTNCIVRLAWRFEVEERLISSIHIYKGSNHPTVEPELFKVIPKEDIIYLGDYEWMVLDERVVPKVKYYYKVMMIYKDGSESEFSRINDILVLTN